MTVPIGRPLANVRYYVLDPKLQPVPLGVPGELCIGGDQVARGYVNRPELTIDRFVPDPFSETPSARMYRSGDRVRYLPDGQVEFLGRRDDQVKIRGFRIELGEVEAALRGVIGVGDAVVSVVPDTAGTTQLVAFVVPEEGVDLLDRELTALLSMQLPDYMIPAHFVLVSSLPRTPHGKIDRRALVVPDVSNSLVSDGIGYVPPRDEIEEQVASMFAEVLGVDRIGVQDNFFDMGGHSLLAMQLLSRVQSMFSVRVTVGDLFAYPTVNGVASVVKGARAEAQPAPPDSRRRRALAIRSCPRTPTEVSVKPGLE
jgi:acyl carrier protein